MQGECGLPWATQPEGVTLELRQWAAGPDVLQQATGLETQPHSHEKTGLEQDWKGQGHGCDTIGALGDTQPSGTREGG